MSQKYNFHRFVVCFQSLMNMACRSTQNAAHIKRFLRLHIAIKPLIKNKHNKSLIMWKRNSFKISLQIWHLSKVRTGWPYKWFWKFFERFRQKVSACFDGSELNECNLSWKIVNYCILYEVCMIKTAPHKTLSPQMWCIKSIKGWFARTQICWQDFVK